MSESVFHRAIYLTGPTAAGKTEIGVVLAGRLNAEVLALDSMTLYRGMDIATAKPSSRCGRKSPPFDRHDRSLGVGECRRLSGLGGGRGKSSRGTRQTSLVRRWHAPVSEGSIAWPVHRAGRRSRAPHAAGPRSTRGRRTGDSQPIGRPGSWRSRASSSQRSAENRPGASK